MARKRPHLTNNKKFQATLIQNLKKTKGQTHTETYRSFEEAETLQYAENQKYGIKTADRGCQYSKYSSDHLLVVVCLQICPQRASSAWPLTSWPTNLNFMVRFAKNGHLDVYTGTAQECHIKTCLRGVIGELLIEQLFKQVKMVPNTTVHARVVSFSSSHYTLLLGGGAVPWPEQRRCAPTGMQTK